MSTLLQNGGGTTNSRQLPPLLQMAICVGGIYCSFIVWALCQERLSTTPYKSSLTSHTDKFRSVLFLNTVQSSFSAISALSYLYTTKYHAGRTTWASIVGLQHSHPIPASPKEHHQQPLQTSSRNLLRSYAFISFVASIASPFGFLSLSHISFPTLLLGKSCKLVPVMLMNVVLYQRKYPAHKYALVGMVTLGIWAFMAFKDTSGKAMKGPATSSLLGLGLLTINLILDGVVNSTQDEVFSRYPHIEGPQMMFFMNVFSTLLTLSALLLPTSLTPSFLLPTPTPLKPNFIFKHPPTPSIPFNALTGALSFISTHQGVTKDILLFSLTGAIGQLFIFLTLSLYGSLTLVTITVTRKMVTMLLSVFVFDHRLTLGQWVGTAVVFVAIGMEAEVKRRETVAKKRSRTKRG